MSRKELALETELLLQGVTQITRHTTVESVLEDVETPPLSEYEAAKDALLAKLRKKKEANQAQQQQLNQRRYGLLPAPTNDLFLPQKRRMQTLKLPVAATATASSRKKQDMLSKLKMQAIQQGAQHMAELFGYTSYEEHLKHLNKLEKMKIAEGEMMEKQKQEKKEGEPTNASVEMSVDLAEQEGESDCNVKTAEAVVELTDGPFERTTESEEQESVKVVRRRNRVQKQDVGEEEDGNEADSEQDDKDIDDADKDMEDATTAGEVMDDTRQEEQDTAEVDGQAATISKSITLKDKAAGYRNLLRAEAMQNRKRKRLVKGRGDNFVESEAEEDEEEDVLKIGGLGDFGFGVPQAKTQESKEAEEERNALKLREDDLDHIVDDLSDDERAQEQDLEEMFRREQEDQDRQQVKEVMRNVKEGFGRNRRAFSGLYSGSGARGRFNLDELVAADGSKLEAARLGLLESDEELSEDDDGKKKKKKTRGDNEEGEEEEEGREDEDEEVEMERLLRERFLNQPKIYVTSSESGSDNEEEEAKKDNGSDGDEIESDEERERQQMKHFSERARINRRMQRMKDMQRQIVLENNEADPTAKSNAAMPNLLLDEDEDSQELMHLLNRTDIDSASSSQTATGSSAQKKGDRPRSKFGRFNSYGGITSASRTSSSFSHVIGQCKMFSANSAGGSATSKGFVFTCFSSDKADDENAAPNHDEAIPAAHPDLGKSKSWSGAKALSKRCGASGASKMVASNKKHKSGGLFSVLSSYQCVSNTSQS